MGSGEEKKEEISKASVVFSPLLNDLSLS